MVTFKFLAAILTDSCDKSCPTKTDSDCYGFSSKLTVHKVHSVITNSSWFMNFTITTNQRRIITTNWTNLSLCDSRKSWVSRMLNIKSRRVVSNDWIVSHPDSYCVQAVTCIQLLLIIMIITRIKVTILTNTKSTVTLTAIVKIKRQ